MQVEFTKDTWIYKKGQVVDLTDHQAQAVVFSGEGKIVQRTSVIPQAIRKAIKKG